MSAHLYGMLLFSRTFSLARIEIAGEHRFVIGRARDLLVNFGINPRGLKIGRTARGHSIKIEDRKIIDRLFFDFGYTGEEPSVRIIDRNFLCDGCLAAFISGCFVTGGSITDPSRGYHLEFSTHRANLCGDLCEILARAGFEPRRTTRGYARLLYFKNSTQIEDLLTYTGAVRSSLELMDAKIYKDVVNTVNRRTNCENANIDKLVSSAARDKAAIEYIARRMGDRHLPENLDAVARLRLDNPDIPLSELGGMLDPPLTKSGVSHRLRRIREEAERLKKLEG
jgi:DNA-binding protein WhiA